MGMSNKQVGLLVGGLIIAFVAGGFFLTGGMDRFGAEPQPLAAVGEGESADELTPPVGYVPHALSGGYNVFVFNAEDKDAVYGASDVYGKIWNPGTADWTGPYVTSSTTYDGSTGDLNFTGTKLMTGSVYDMVIYQGDGGTNLYPETTTFTIPKLSPELTSWALPDTLYMSTEGSFSESACTNTAGSVGNESSDLIYLNKTAYDVQGTLKWDCKLGQGTAGGVLKDVVIIFRDKPGSELTDINDVEHIYLSTKSGGSGLSFPGGDLVGEFLGGVPILVGPSDGIFRSSNDATITIEVDLPAAEANVGTGSIEMIFDDLGDYRAKADVFDTKDYDVHAAAEITEFRICTTTCT